MKLSPAAHELISNMRAFFQIEKSKLSYLNEEPLRSELFSSDQLERFGKSLAGKHQLSTRPATDHLLKRLSDNNTVLNEVRKLLTDSIKRKYQITPGGEWLIDNFYLIEEHIRNAKTHFPKGYSEALPQLSGKGSAGLTRVYDIVLHIISHSDGRIDIESLSGFIKAYQTVTHLQLGELWAIPIMLRLALIENLRRVSARIAIDRVDGNLADYWAKQMNEAAEKDPKNLILVIADMARSNPPLVSSFVSELTRQLRGRGPGLALALNWIEQQLSESGLTSTELVNSEIQKQAVDQVSMSNSIGSLRLLGAMDWREFVETQSVVHQKLLEDNAGTYAQMDFQTRDQYRHVVEHISKKSDKTEYDVATIAIELMRANTQEFKNDNRTAHVGYYLTGKGARETKELANMHVSLLRKLKHFFRKQAFLFYLIFIALVTFSLTACVFMKARVETNNPMLLVFIALLLILCASQLAISVVNFFATFLVKPHLLPRMDFSKEIPEDSRTMVVVPIMLTSIEEIEHLVEALEVRFLANRNKNLHFSLLTDFTDANLETLPGDKVLLDFVSLKLSKLNAKYHRDKEDLFFLFHRPRNWNVQENVWMGYERKRGKLSELNSLLRGGAKDRFSLITGDQSLFPSIKYVIILDADTQLPLASAWKLIGTMAHPLNRPWYSEKKKRVTRGYTILQPLVTVSLPDLNSSRYARMHGNEPGIDPYTQASSDVYQDLFDEGSFIGKGIYEVDMFKNVLDGKFSENGILSHDLLEGCYVRSGVVSDVQLFEKYPTRYSADMKRRSRWVRGDWQIFSWFLPFVPGPGRHLYKNPISGLSRWKIFDNIRRSLVPLALTTLVLIGWLVLPSSAFWTITVSSIIILPIVIASFWDTIRKPKDVIVIHHLKNSFCNITDVLKKTGFILICLPYEAYSNLNSISRTLWRLLVSRRNLLEWNPSANEERANPTGLFASYSNMWIQPFLAALVFIYLGINAPISLVVSSPIAVFWLLAPLIVWFVGKPLNKQVTSINEEQKIFLRKIARKTWSFFERFVTKEDNWLPPDNYQEEPFEQIAHRTSPTNIGLSLLSTIVAHDFAYLNTSQLLERTAKTLDSMHLMERYKGHFYNWYDTETLEPLLPRYISTVDSGNLAGHLLTAKQGLLAIPFQAIASSKIVDGIRDTWFVLRDCLQAEEKDLYTEFSNVIEFACQSDLSLPEYVKIQLDVIDRSYALVYDAQIKEGENETQWWKKTLHKQIVGAQEELRLFEPWVTLKSIPATLKGFETQRTPTNLIELLDSAKTLEQQVVNEKTAASMSSSEKEWLDILQNQLKNSILFTVELHSTIDNLARQCNELSDMEWSFLYNKLNNLFTIGYNVQEHHSDASYYDLLASEARLCIFIGIAQGKLPEESWFALGRLLTNVDGSSILLSWSGSMFEYLMPLLVMPTYENTLLDQTYKAAVEWQIKYGKKTGLPWGISESAFNMMNANSNYQYRAFGAPGLGLKRGLEEDSVIAPYASALALMVLPEKACANLELLSQKGFEGRYGFYEAIDYTASRLAPGETNMTVRAFMAHHQGMSLLSFAYLLLDKPMQKLFEAEPQFKATLLLLQERIPKASTFFAHTTDIEDINTSTSGTEIRVLTNPNTRIPDVQLLSNGKYHVMVSNAGGGYSRWKDLAVTRWREDGTRDNWGNFCYIRDIKNETYWSNTYQPTLKKSKNYEAAFSQGRVDFHCTHDEIETQTVIVVSPEDDIEMRRVCITNNSNFRRTLEITSYAEVVLATPASDVMQPAFSNLFVQTEILPTQNAIMCTRRPRSTEEKSPYMFHLMALQGKVADEISYETDRMEFIGRGNSTLNPQVMERSGPLSGSQGSVLDPVVAIRYKITLDPDEMITLDLMIGIGENKEVCQNLIDKYQDKHHKDRVFELAWTHSQVVLRQINATEVDAQLYGRLASSILFQNSVFRADPSILISNHRGQSGLWGYSISGDFPIVLLKIESQTSMSLVKQLVQAHAYWSLKGLVVDLVIWNEEHNGYRQIFQNEIEALIPAEFKDRNGGIFVRAADQISSEDRILFQTVARLSISDADGTLEEQVTRKANPRLTIPYISPTENYENITTELSLPEGLIFQNGLGGFSADGTEYIITTDLQTKTPVPWANVIANPNFGTVISESGSAYTWTENAHELRLTPWNNDPVGDSSGEAFYLRDEESGKFWSTSLLPSGGTTPYITRHGFGYSVFEHSEDGIYSEMLVYVDLVSAIKFTVLKIRNQSGRHRTLSATGYTEWVLGDDKAKTGMYVYTEIDPDSGALFAKNPYNTEFQKRVAFFDVDALKKTFTGDRTEFIGRNGSLKNPDAMSRVKLSGQIGLALDPCAALQVPFELEEGEEYELVFRLGVGKDSQEAGDLAKQFRGKDVAHHSLEKVKDYWKQTLGVLQIETPDTSLNILTNGWLTYQTLSSRLWARSGFYQSGGAFGFRDQLQDVLSLVYTVPNIAREQILLSASRQFKEGDVQHWWHPPLGRGVRTRCSDDYLWLPFVTALYLKQSGDNEILNESVNFLEGRLLNPGEESYYDLPSQSQKTATLYEHCVLAIKHGFRYGEHGLPLIGSGDWNDGFDKVGLDGKGESVWLAFFLYEILNLFSVIAKNHNDSGFAETCRQETQKLKDNIDAHAWDGQWYKRAWFDDGKVLGSAANVECKIDSIAQSWSVLSGAGTLERSNTAMESAYKELVEKKGGIIKLLDPPFDSSDLNPGYIKGYVPGVRENGGQYTHAAIWLIMAFAKLGDKKRVWELLKMINPINHAKTNEEVAIYKVEPYVVAADVYASTSHMGRGGWTWYTGSAGWMYRLITEFFLGLQREGNKLRFVPCIPEDWESFKAHYKHNQTLYHIEIIQLKGVGEMIVRVDEMEQQDKMVTLAEDGSEHQVQVTVFGN
jgi:cyclic beta-1,2-glucan synthetase